MKRKKRNKFRKLEIFSIVLFLVVLTMLLYVISRLWDESYQCMQNPLIFGAGQLKESNNAEFMCSCTLAKPNSPSITFDSTGMKVDRKIEGSFKSFNNSEWEGFIPPQP